MIHAEPSLRLFTHDRFQSLLYEAAGYLSWTRSGPREDSYAENQARAVGQRNNVMKDSAEGISSYTMLLKTLCHCRQLGLSSKVRVDPSGRGLRTPNMGELPILIHSVRETVSEHSEASITKNPGAVATPTKRTNFTNLFHSCSHPQSL
jgi:hypothetical protein